MKRYRIVVVGNYLNHHSIPLYNNLNKMIPNKFLHISTKIINPNRLKIGYVDLSQNYPYNINAYESNEKYLMAKRYINDADIVIIGDAPEHYIEDRLNQNRLIIRMSERLFKEGIWKLIHPKIAFKYYKKHISVRSKNVHMLCISAYLPWDLFRLGAYKNKMYKWGYFPETIQYSKEEIIDNKTNLKPKLLWVGRMIWWKNPKFAIKLAKKLKYSNYSFELNIIGTGPQEKIIKKLIEKNNLGDCVNLLGSKTPQEVRRYMENSNIFLFTSNFREGWGAVLNEAMNSACVVVASHSIGSVPFLLNHGHNGYIYENNNLNDAYQTIIQVLSDKNSTDIGIEAYKTIYEIWNADNASKKLLELCQNILDYKNIYEINGPCSKAIIIKNTKFK